MERDGVKVYLAKVCRPPECSIMRCIAMYSKFSSRLSFRYTGSSTQGLA
jgi:hypothetical protein